MPRSAADAGRCSTCRVRVAPGHRAPATAQARHEVKVLARFQGAPNIRLACQLRPTQDITILPLLPPDIAADDRRRRSAGAAETERFVAIMFIDIREIDRACGKSACRTT